MSLFYDALGLPQASFALSAAQQIQMQGNAEAQRRRRARLLARETETRELYNKLRDKIWKELIEQEALELAEHYLQLGISHRDATIALLQKNNECNLRLSTDTPVQREPSAQTTVRNLAGLLYLDVDTRDSQLQKQIPQPGTTSGASICCLGDTSGDSGDTTAVFLNDVAYDPASSANVNRTSSVGMPMSFSYLQQVTNGAYSTAPQVTHVQTSEEFVLHWNELSRNYNDARLSAQIYGQTDDIKAAMIDAVHKQAALLSHTAQMNPTIALGAGFAMLPENTELCRNIAAVLLPRMSTETLTTLRQAFREYDIRVGKAGLDIEVWAPLLQKSAKCTELSPFAVIAGAAVDISWAASKLLAALQESFQARKAVMEKFTSLLTKEQVLYINSASLPYMPDYMAIITHLHLMARAQYPVKTPFSFP